MPAPLARLAPPAPVLLHEFFERAARAGPERIAINVPPTARRPQRRLVTYRELQRRTEALAAFLREFVTGECVVVLFLPRNSEHLYAAQLAVLKAGAAYACIDPIFPDEQVRAILADAQPVAILTGEAGLSRCRRLPAAAACVLDVVDWSERARAPSTPLAPAPWLTPHSLAYLIYTSGTTGQPKGVMIEHGGIANLVEGDLRTLGVTPEDRVGQSSSCAYDSSVEETWFALAAGATLVVMDDETTRLGPDLIGWLRREAITMFCPPPTLLRATGCEYPERELPDLRLVHVGGEALPVDVAERSARGRCLVNDYGPTECTVTARARAGRAECRDHHRPAGARRPSLGAQRRARRSGRRRAGRAMSRRPGSARGYMNDPELTAQKFPLHPRLGRIYRSGDLVHRDLDGNYYCHGRIDTQVKLRGYRIELEAIEARLAACAGVRATACCVQGEGAQQKLVAFVVPADASAPPAADDLKRALRQVLPEYMVPTRFGTLERLPTAVSGKLNRRALPVLSAHGPAMSGSYTPPRDGVEAKLAFAFQNHLDLNESVSVHHDFFNDLGGESLTAARLISGLRDDPTTASLTVRDLYEARTVAELARRTRPAVAPPTAAVRPTGQPFLATVVQSLWLIAMLLVGAPVAYLLAFQALPLLTHDLGLIPLLLLAPLFYAIGLFGYIAATVALAVGIKNLLIGRYRPTRAPVWGSFYVRNWIVQQAVRLVPWRLLEGTVMQQSVLRAWAPGSANASISIAA